MAYRQQRHSSGLVKCFLAAAGAIIGGGSAALYTDHIRTSVDAHNAKIDKIANMFNANASDICISGKTRQPVKKQTYLSRLFHLDDTEKEKAPTRTQEFLKKVLAKMDETQIGKALNQSTAEHDTILCAPMDKYSIFYAAYHPRPTNLITINLAKYDSFESATQKPENFHRIMRSTYEESTHAWQDNEKNMLSAPSGSNGQYKTAWAIALEASAKAITFAALYQHHQKGDHAIWDNNTHRPDNKTMMQALKTEIEKTDGNKITRNALWHSFNSFYEMDRLIRLYQAHYSSQNAAGKDANMPDTESLKAMQSNHEKQLGIVPGMTGNYFNGRNSFTLNQDRYSKSRLPSYKTRATP